MNFDGNWVDVSSILTAAAVGFHRPVRRRFTLGTWHCQIQEIISDVLSGSSIMPFVLMIGSVFSSQILKTALETNKLYMAIGGLIGLVVLAYEIAKPGVGIMLVAPRTAAPATPPSA